MPRRLPLTRRKGEYSKVLNKPKKSTQTSLTSSVGVNATPQTSEISTQTPCRQEKYSYASFDYTSSIFFNSNWHVNTCGDKGQALVLSKVSLPRQVLEFSAAVQPSGFTAAPSSLHCSILIAPNGIKKFFF